MLVDKLFHLKASLNYSFEKFFHKGDKRNGVEAGGFFGWLVVGRFFRFVLFLCDGKC